MDNGKTDLGDRHDDADRKEWVEPSVEELPPLTDLTLESVFGDPIPGGGGTGGGGSTVF